MRLVFWVPPSALISAAFAGAVITWLGARAVASPFGLLPGILISTIALCGLARWGWAMRPARGKLVLFICEFSERSTHGNVRTGLVHRRELIDKLEAVPLLADIVEIRKLPPLAMRAAKRVLRRTPGCGVIRGDTVVAGNELKWTASMGYRLLAHSRYAATTDHGQAAFIRGAVAWSPLQLLRFPVDPQMPISILASQDFPASHAEGVTAMAIAIRGVNAQTPAQLAATVAAVRDRWRSAPDPARALAVIGEAELARLDSGWPAVRKVLLAGIRRDRVRDPLLQRFFAGSVSIACAHRMETAERWLYATDPLIAMTDREPNAVYLRGSALMAARRWSDAVECLLPLANERFGGPLAPDPREVLSALFQAADLADNQAVAVDALQRLRRTMWRKRWWNRPPPKAVMTLLAWAQVHNYDGLALDAMEQRLRQLGRAVQDIVDLRAELDEPA